MVCIAFRGFPYSLADSSTESYAEWYWWNLNQGPDTKDQTWKYHLDTYGPDVVYDDFIQNFTASVFDPKEWVDLFADAGAQYFVQVSKHHDGYAIFDLPANVSNRTSVALPPHRNLLHIAGVVPSGLQRVWLWFMVCINYRVCGRRC
jgi:alpha-L-fucosidase